MLIAGGSKFITGRLIVPEEVVFGNVAPNDDDVMDNCCTAPAQMIGAAGATTGVGGVNFTSTCVVFVQPVAVFVPVTV